VTADGGTVRQLVSSLLQVARATLDPDLLPSPVGLRTSALLARLALEHDVAGRLRTSLPGAEDGSMRAQLLCLRAVAPTLGEDAAHLHGALSRVCHHHPYELGPGVEELAGLLDAVTALTATPAGAASPAGAVTPAGAAP
jgi:hypothetical protein